MKPSVRSLHRHRVSESLELNNNNSATTKGTKFSGIQSKSFDLGNTSQGDELRRLKASRSLKFPGQPSNQLPTRL